MQLIFGLYAAGVCAGPEHSPICKRRLLGEKFFLKGFVKVPGGTTAEKRAAARGELLRDSVETLLRFSSQGTHFAFEL
jgi:hypothetical protein